MISNSIIYLYSVLLNFVYLEGEKCSSTPVIHPLHDCLITFISITAVYCFHSQIVVVSKTQS